MINLKNINKSSPYKKFLEFYNHTLKEDQKNIEAICISSYNKKLNEVDSRFVNLKYIIDDEWIFFSNYDSPKSNHFELHNQISCLFYWNKTDMQIRIKAKISKTKSDFSDQHYASRIKEKNILAHLSKQSQPIESYKSFLKNYESKLDNTNYNERPKYWGGFSFVPYYFEFWKGHKNRVNKRETYKLEGLDWKKRYIQP